MKRVLLLGDGASTLMLQRILSDRGVDVVVDSAIASAAAGDEVKIVVDDLCAELDARILGGVGGAVPRGLLATAMGDAAPRLVSPFSEPSAHADPRPYLKRKKGRDGAAPGRRASSQLNGIAKRRNRA